MTIKKGFRRLSVSLGTGALPVVREALDHADANPLHNPILTVAMDDDGQHAYWTCDGLAVGGLPGSCAKGGDV